MLSSPKDVVGFENLQHTCDRLPILPLFLEMGSVNNCTQSTCDDGKAGGDEVSIDCGGSCSKACNYQHTFVNLPRGPRCSLKSLESKLRVLDQGCNTSNAMGTSSLFPACESDLSCAVAYVAFYKDCEHVVSALYKSRTFPGEASAQNTAFWALHGCSHTSHF